MTTIDTSTEAVERLASDHQTVGDNPAKYVMGHPHHWKTAAVLRQLVKERDEAVDAKLDALSTLDAWFDRSELGNEAVNQAVIDAASGYLRTSRVGGMPQVESDLILGVMQDMSRIGLFADIFARAMNDLVPALLKERDDLRAKMDAAVETLEEIAATEVFSMGVGIDPRPTNEAKIARAILAKIKGADHE